jgi:hypothetical protein
MFKGIPTVWHIQFADMPSERAEYAFRVYIVYTHHTGDREVAVQARRVR